MNRKRIVLGIGVAAAVLALSLTAFAAFRIAVMPSNAVIILAAPAPVTFDGFCSDTPCNIKWTLVLSASNLGSIDNATGPKTTFTPTGTATGSAFLFASDGNGHIAQATINVQ